MRLARTEKHYGSRLPFISTGPLSARPSESSQGIQSPDVRSRLVSYQTKDPLYRKGGAGVGLWPWDLLFVSQTRRPEDASLAEMEGPV